jgi:hypothetical protein
MYQHPLQGPRLFHQPGVLYGQSTIVLVRKKEQQSLLFQGCVYNLFHMTRQRLFQCRASCLFLLLLKYYLRAPVRTPLSHGVV